MNAAVWWLVAAAAAGAAAWRVRDAPYGEGVAGRLRLALWKAWKGAQRRATGQCELERLCRVAAAAGDPQAVLTARLEASLALSDQLPTVRRDLRSPSLDVELAMTNAASIKHLPDDAGGEVAVRRRLRAALEDVLGVNRLVALLAETRAPYNRENRRHEALLRRLWDLLQPERGLDARVSKQWADLGFQGTDPATDFRAMGLLGLQNLVAFAERWPDEAQRVLADAQSREAWFPFAITGINLTAELCRLTRERKLCQYFYARGATLESFNRLYAVLFSRFNRHWERAAPETVMSFQEVWRDFMGGVVADDADGRLAHLEP